MRSPDERTRKFATRGWALKPFRGDGTRQRNQWWMRVDQWDGKLVEICPLNGDGTMTVYTMTRRDARLLAKRINEMLEATK